VAKVTGDRLQKRALDPVEIDGVLAPGLPPGPDHPARPEGLGDLPRRDDEGERALGRHVPLPGGRDGARLGGPGQQPQVGQGAVAAGELRHGLGLEPQQPVRCGRIPVDARGGEQRTLQAETADLGPGPRDPALRRCQGLLDRRHEPIALFLPPQRHEHARGPAQVAEQGRRLDRPEVPAQRLQAHPQGGIVDAVRVFVCDPVEDPGVGLHPLVLPDGGPRQQHDQQARGRRVSIVPRPGL
jgi:hypothetical protein